jgi:hypothetical protein
MGIWCLALDYLHNGCVCVRERERERERGRERGAAGSGWVGKC